MQINNHAAPTPALPLREALTPTPGIAFEPETDKDKTSTSTKPPATAAAGFSIGLLASETANALLRAGQEVEASGPDKTRTPQDIQRDYFMGIATDPAEAERKAWELGNGELLLAIPSEVFEQMKKDGTMSKIGIDLSRSDHPIQLMGEKRKAFHNQMVKDDVPPLEMIERLYEFNIELPLDYSNDVLDPTGTHQKDYYRDWHKDQLANMREAIREAHNTEPGSGV